MSEHDDQRTTPAEAGRAGCEFVVLLLLAVVLLLAFGPAMMALAPLPK